MSGQHKFPLLIWYGITSESLLGHMDNAQKVYSSLSHLLVMPHFYTLSSVIITCKCSGLFQRIFDVSVVEALSQSIIIYTLDAASKGPSFPLKQCGDARVVLFG